MHSRLGLSIAFGALCLTNSSPLAAAEDPALARWINASEVNLRTQPGTRGAVLALLPLGTAVRWIGTSEGASFCEVDAAGARGFVACRFLSASAPSMPSAGATAGATGPRWISGAGVILRAEPSSASPVVARLALNARVELLAPAGESPYCEIATGVAGAASARGYTACRYLATTPLATDRIVAPTLADGQPNPSYDPVRAFWLAPSWVRLEAYGAQLGAALKARTGTPPEDLAPPVRPADPEFDRMKAHLARGIYGAVPAPMPAWDDVKRLARKVASRAPTWALTEERRSTIWRTEEEARTRLAGVLGLFDSPFQVGADGGARLAGLVGALDLPGVRSSLFASASDVAPPDASIEDLSGRFHVVAAYRTRGRDLGESIGTVGCVWDIGQVTAALTQPLTRTIVRRDGRVVSRVERPSETRVLRGQGDGHPCENDSFGFAHGDADPRLWRDYFGAGYQRDPDTLKRNPEGSLLSIWTRIALPASGAAPIVSTQSLDREKTGFVRGMWLHFDLDADGVPDLAVWEGTGQGPGQTGHGAGHVDGVGASDDAYYRLFFANIGGRWHVLGHDVFSFGCGC